MDFTLQPSYELIPTYYKANRTIRKIVYKADFLVFYPEKQAEIIDIKTEGTMTPVFKLKRKLFDYFYPNLELKLLTWSGSEWRELPIKKGTAKKKGVDHDKRNVSLPRR